MVFLVLIMYNIKANGCCFSLGEKMIPIVKAEECHTAWTCTTRDRCVKLCRQRHKGGIGDCSVFPPPGIPSQCVCNFNAPICPRN